MSIKPIETRYRGYRFRSRLEARWAVFFDALDIRWRYEHEGFELKVENGPKDEFRLGIEYYYNQYTDDYWEFSRTHPNAPMYTFDQRSHFVYEYYAATVRPLWYLPDFWLPELDMWAEVKPCNNMTITDAAKMINFELEIGMPLAHCACFDENVCIVPDPMMPFGRNPSEFWWGINVAKSARFEHGETPRFPSYA